MNRRRKAVTKLTLGLVITIISTAVILAGIILFYQASENQLTTEEKAEFLTEVEPIIESLLEGIMDDNYSKFSEHLDNVMIEGLPPESFQVIRDQVTSEAGLYLSKVSSDVSRVSEGGVTYLRVVYNAEYERSEVVWTVVFPESDETRSIAGLFFRFP